MRAQPHLRIGGHSQDSYLAEVFREEERLAIAGVDPEPWGIEVSTDVLNFVNDADIETITWGPGDTTQPTTFGEHVDSEAATTGHDVIASALRDLVAVASGARTGIASRPICRTFDLWLSDNIGKF